ncbi:type I methionyl aminopeptidase [bacterium]|nr:type I methionyl aminopeptidase [bacterium]
MIAVRSEAELSKIRKSADLLVKIFHGVEPHLKAGIATREIDAMADEIIRSGGGRPAFKGYMGYPASVCISIDEEVVHGIPGDAVIKEGALVSLDIGVEMDGFYSDAAKTYGIGNMTDEKTRLMIATKEALYKGLSQCRSGKRLSDISHAIQSHAEGAHFSVVRSLVGHGVGRKLHEPPQIPNFGSPHQGPKLSEGMVFAIEPMVNMGTYEVEIQEDGWTVKTRDRLPSAHFEHTVIVRKGGPEILTFGIEDEPWRWNG